MALTPVPPSDQWTFRRIMWATFVLVIVALSFWLLYRFYQVVFILFIAIVFGTVIRPVVRWLNRRGLPRSAAVILVYLLILTLLISFVLLLFPLIIEQGATIASSVPNYYQNLREGMVNFPNQWIVRLSDFLPMTLPNLAPMQHTGEQVLASAGQALGYMGSLFRSFLIFSAILLLAFQWTLHGPRIIQSSLLLIRRDQREGMSEMISAMEGKVGYYIAGQSFLCLIIGIMALVAYLLIGLPNALVLAVVAGIMEAVPLIGPLLGAIPASIIALSIAPSKLVWVIVATIVIQQVENSLLVPRVMRKAVGVNPFVSLLAIFAFSSFFGIAGALMAIPMAAMIHLILDRVVFHPGTMDSEISAGRDYTSRLRYEVQDLAQDLRKHARLDREGSELWVKQTDRVMDEIEAISTDLDSLLAQMTTPGVS
jgi:predicted PurR-regulated permease PerM